MSTTIVHLLMIAIVLVGADADAGYSHNHLTSYLLQADNGKDARCREPMMTDPCNTSSVYRLNDDWTVSGWFYHSTFKSCRPLYSRNGMPGCEENQDLPKTRNECENVCADFCIMSNGEVGICMFDFYCRVHNEIPDTNPKPCGTNRVNCCPQIDDETLTSTDLSDKNCNQFVHNVSVGNSFDTYYTYVFPGYLNLNG